MSHLATGVTVIGLAAVIILFMGPRLLGWQLVVVLSGSMEPTLPVGSVALVEPSHAASVRVGDVLTFRLPEGATNRPQGKVIQVTHRVVEVLQQGQTLGFRTQGDANDQPDEYIVPADNVVGTVRWQVPHAGYLADRVRTRTGFLLLVALPGALIVAGELRNIWREIRTIRSRKKLAAEAKR